MCLLLWGTAALLGAPRAADAQEVTAAQAALQLESTLVQAIAKGERSVVAIARVKVQRGDGFARPEFNPFVPPRGIIGRPPVTSATMPDFIPNRFGTGVIVDRNLILTNYHVIDDDFMSEDREAANPIADDIYVWAISWKADPPRPQAYLAKVKAADPRSDLAVLEITAEELEPIRFAPIKDPVKELKKGQIAIALGNPYAIARDGSPSASWGIIANVARKAGPELDALGEGDSKTTLHHFGTLIQTDAKLNLGTSGGALLNLKGEMIGLTTSLSALAGFEQAAGYAIPVDDMFRRVVDALKKGREVEYGFLGVQPRNLADEERQRGLHGIMIQSVQQGTPAYGKLTIEEIIIAVNGKPIFDVDGLMLNVGKLPVGEIVRLTVGGRKDPVEVSLAKYPIRGRKIVTSPSAAWRGIRVDYPTGVHQLVAQPQPHQWTALVEGCVVVTDVASDSPAAAAAIQKWNLITHVDNIRIHTPDQFRDAVAGKKGRVRLRLGDESEERAVRNIDPKGPE